MDAAYQILAEAFRYPKPGAKETLLSGRQALPEGSARRAFGDFVSQIETLTLSQWEELYTRTFDLNPTTAPYVGFQVWGESYLRGSFLAEMNHAIQELGIEADGELPDHVIPIFRYLAQVEEPLPALLEVLGNALQSMQRALKSSEPDNPFVRLFDAAIEYEAADRKRRSRRDSAKENR